MFVWVRDAYAIVGMDRKIQLPVRWMRRGGSISIDVDPDEPSTNAGFGDNLENRTCSAAYLQYGIDHLVSRGALDQMRDVGGFIEGT